ncbi:unnamed protein product [Caenorhabditis auriculariae]|uniref:Galectin n=1 Tax=Caenorhabditis auriculariae TaxID=2777116 RepID=A0A8S1GRT7_9PELO|nr:unnamed protein product [Caenorhabditis auriculariae]
MHNVHKPSVPGTYAIYESLRDGVEIGLNGHVRNSHHKDFSVELLSGPHIVLHVNFRFHHDHIVCLNSASHGNWGPELRHSNPLKHGEHFHLSIKVHSGYYHISVNGVHLADFPHRFPVESVQAVGLKGDLHADEITFEGFDFHRDWNAQHDFGHSGYNSYGTESYVAPSFNEGHSYNAYF